MIYKLKSSRVFLRRVPPIHKVALKKKKSWGNNAEMDAAGASCANKSWFVVPKINHKHSSSRCINCATHQAGNLSFCKLYFLGLEYSTEQAHRK